MKLVDFLDLVADSQDMWVSYEGLAVEGIKDALVCMLSDDVYQGIVYEIEAEGSELKVWVKEDANAAY